jgi:hypothetical protein
VQKIYINPGHSDKDPGAVGYETERKLNVKVSRYMNEYLLANYECETKMNPGSMDSLSVICNDANTWGADLFVSNHFNAACGDGYEALVFNQNRVALGKVFEHYVLAAGQNSRGVKLRPDLTVLSKTHMPAVLNEGAFVDNLKDIQDWNDNFELQKLGEAYAKAAAEFLGLKVKVKTPVETSFTLKLRVLRNGDTGEDVQALQILLNGSGKDYNCGTADGIYGSKTEGAVRKYQEANKLPATGAADAATFKKLLGVS